MPLFSTPIKFKAALASRRLKKIMPTAADSAALLQLAPEIRERAMFLAQVNHAGMVGQTHAAIRGVLGDGMAAFNPATARADLKLYLAAMGYDPEQPPEGFAPAKPGSIQDLSSDRRLDLVLDTNLKMAHGKGQHSAANDPDLLDAFPCWELYRLEARKEERKWLTRWVMAGGQLYGANRDRMIAPKDSPVWTKLGPFKLPYPPFDYNSGMWTEDVDRSEAEALGVIQPSTMVEPQNPPFNHDVRGAVHPGLSGDLLDAVRRAFGSAIQMLDGAFVLNRL